LTIDYQPDRKQRKRKGNRWLAVKEQEEEDSEDLPAITNDFLFHLR
jgi:hypothetical protein